METRRPAARSIAFLSLSLVFVLPAIQRLLELSAQGAIRRVDLALVLAGGFAAGVFFALAVSTLRKRQPQS